MLTLIYGGSYRAVALFRVGDSFDLLTGSCMSVPDVCAGIARHCQSAALVVLTAVCAGPGVKSVTLQFECRH